jgi:hypothetical protein
VTVLTGRLATILIFASTCAPNNEKLNASKSQKKEIIAEQSEEEQVEQDVVSNLSSLNSGTSLSISGTTLPECTLSRKCRGKHAYREELSSIKNQTQSVKSDNKTCFRRGVILYKKPNFICEVR